MASPSQDRGQWSGKLAFVLAAAGSAVGLGNIWKFPSEVAGNGGAAFLLIYLLCCFLVGFPLMCAEMTLGRRTNRNPVGAFKALSSNPAYALIGGWGVLCGVMILSFYAVVAGWTFSAIFGELFRGLGNESLAGWFSGAQPGMRSALFAVAFILVTILIVSGGVRTGIERATKTMMPALVGLMLVMIVYVVTRPGASEGLMRYLKPDFSLIDANLFFEAMGQAFFSLSLGMGALITYGSYLGKKQNIPEAAALVTLADVGIAFLAGLLIMPTMYLAQGKGIAIFDPATGSLLREEALIFDVLPALFSSMGPVVGLIFGLAFFILLSMAALTSTISLLEVPVSYAIDERGIERGKAAWGIGIVVGAVAAFIAFKLSLIGTLVTIFSDIGLPLGGLAILLFLAWVWRTDNALGEIREGFADVDQSFFGRLWPPLVKYVCPILILIVLGTKLRSLF